jgi:hypothetical protein
MDAHRLPVDADPANARVVLSGWIDVIGRQRVKTLRTKVSFFFL